MVIITICAVICGANNWVEIENYGHAKKEALLKCNIDYSPEVSHGDSKQILRNRINPCCFVFSSADQRYTLWGQFPRCPYTVGLSLTLAFCLLL
ncbi:MAG: transposase family protein [Okeania sp. SIO3H1]|uniref:transposase family protein n=1 Tax=Okeania sp. SIO1I7 TaxID=2607772 RepID=UPI0013CA1BA0|nr:transposase family protein [Okeania sp. SIO3H1]NET30076.1 transposase family protein [Okeania sp. SIO1I7]